MLSKKLENRRNQSGTTCSTSYTISLHLSSAMVVDEDKKDDIFPAPMQPAATVTGLWKPDDATTLIPTLLYFNNGFCLKRDAKVPFERLRCELSFHPDHEIINYAAGRRRGKRFFICPAHASVPPLFVCA